MKSKIAMLLACICICLSLPFYIVGDEDFSLPVQSGLVSRYGNFEKEEKVLKDLCGDNDIPNLLGSFEGGYYILNACGQPLPVELAKCFQNQEYTFEISLGAFSPVGIAAVSFVSSLYGSELFSLYIDLSENTLYAVANGNYYSFGSFSGSAVDKLQNATISVCYKAGEKIDLYCNGVLMASHSVPLKTTDEFLSICLSSSNVLERSYIEFKELRFYNRALSEAEIARNTIYDGHHREEPLPSEQTKYANVPLKDLHILGGLAAAEYQNSREQLMSTLQGNSDCAVAIIGIDEEQQFLSQNGSPMGCGLPDFFEHYCYDLLPAFYPTSEKALTALNRYCAEKGMADYLVISDKKEIVERASGQRTVLDLSAKSDAGYFPVEADIVLLPESAEKDAVELWRSKGVMPWLSVNSVEEFDINRFLTLSVYGIACANCHILYNELADLQPSVLTRVPQIIYRPEDTVVLDESVLADGVRKGIKGIVLPVFISEDQTVSVGYKENRMDYQKVLDFCIEKGIALYLLPTEESVLTMFSKMDLCYPTILVEEGKGIAERYPHLNIREYYQTLPSKSTPDSTDGKVYCFSARKNDIYNCLVKGMCTVCLDPQVFPVYAMYMGYDTVTVQSLSQLDEIAYSILPKDLPDTVTSEKEFSVKGLVTTFGGLSYITENVTVHILSGEDLVEKAEQNKIIFKENATGTVRYTISFLQHDGQNDAYNLYSVPASVTVVPAPLEENSFGSGQSDNEPDDPQNRRMSNKAIAVIAIGSAVFAGIVIAAVIVLKKPKDDIK